MDWMIRVLFFIVITFGLATVAYQTRRSGLANFNSLLVATWSFVIIIAAVCLVELLQDVKPCRIIVAVFELIVWIAVAIRMMCKKI